MKRITRKIGNTQEKVWLDQDGHWNRDPERAFQFDDEEAVRRLRRIPHGDLEDVDNEPEKDEAVNKDN